VLAISGGHDVQVPPDDVAAIGRLVQGPFEGHVAGDLSHLLRPDPGSVGPRGYRRAVRQPVSPEVLDLITAWIGQHWVGQHGVGQHGVSQHGASQHGGRPAEQPAASQPEPGRTLPG
jgi:hypothetical protein